MNGSWFDINESYLTLSLMFKQAGWSFVVSDEVMIDDFVVLDQRETFKEHNMQVLVWDATLTFHLV